MQSFWDLAADPAVRMAAAVSLVTELQANQRAVEKAANGGGDDDDSDESGGDEQKVAHPFKGGGGDVVDGWSPNLAYAVKRLFRGLASSRAGARQGFSLALTEVLATFRDVITVQHIHKCMKQHLTCPQGASRQEVRDYMFARIFVVLVVSRADRVREFAADDVVVFVKQTLDFHAKTPLVREVCIAALCALVRALDIDTLEESVWPLLSPLLPKDLTALAPEAITLGVALKDAYLAAGRGKDDTPKAVHRLLNPKYLVSVSVKDLRVYECVCDILAAHD
jgi:DNA polymerase phi